MPITVGSNTQALVAERQLSAVTHQRESVFERLSSGQRITKASDDAAGLAIAATLNSNSRVYNQAVRNLNDGLSALTLADGAISALSDVVIRLQELAEQAANGTYSARQRVAMDAEAQALSEEYTRIMRSAKFNSTAMLDGSLGQVRLQAGYGVEGSIADGIGGAVGTGSFGAAVSYRSETAVSNDVALVDLNGDGYLDLTSAGASSLAVGRATVRLGSGNGSFGAATTYQMESYACYALAMEDVNRDGVVDLLTAGTATEGWGTASIRLGRGNGSFGAAISYRTESVESKGLSLADLNGDSILDLVTAGANSSGAASATVRLGRGDGTFGTARSYQTESASSRDVALGDLNGDGCIDLVTAGANSSGPGSATVRLGRGDGTFGAARSYTSETSLSKALTLGDLDGDGRLDLITAGEALGGAPGITTVRLGRGDGTFGAARSYVMESGGSVDVQVADLNGDSTLDIVTAGWAGAGAATIRLGRGDGTFGASSGYAAEPESMALALGDVSGDGVLDLVTAGMQLGISGWLNVRLARTVEGVSPLLPFSLTTVAGARQALPVFRDKLSQLAAQRGEIGAFQARIGVGINTLQAASENLAAASGRIMDTDVAADAAELTRTAILQQAGTAVLSQANQQPGISLRLLQAS